MKFSIRSDADVRREFLKELELGSEIAATHEEFIHAAGGLAAFADCPDHQGLSAAKIAGGEDAGHAGHVVLIRDDIAALVELEAELTDRAVLFGTEETHRQ